MRLGTSASNDAVRAQAALVRSLVDEIGHQQPAAPQIVNLHEQLAEELSRLSEIVGGQSPSQVFAPRLPLDVLIVEDHDATLRATETLVLELGYRCSTATSAEDALDAYDRQSAAIVVSDWNLPGMSGLDLCRALKRRDAHAYVVLVSAFHDDTHLVEGVQGGVDDFLPKPIDADQFAARVRAAERLVVAVRALEAAKTRLH